MCLKEDLAIPQELLILLRKWKEEREEENTSNHKAHFKTWMSPQKKYYRQQ